MKVWPSFLIAGVFAMRTISPPTYSPGKKSTVMVTVSPDLTTQSYALEEHPPAGWVYTAVDPKYQVFNGPNPVIKFPFNLDNTPRTYVYYATPPRGTSGMVQFNGVASFDGTSVLVGGSSLYMKKGQGP